MIVTLGRLTCMVVTDLLPSSIVQQPCTFATIMALCPVVKDSLLAFEWNMELRPNENARLFDDAHRKYACQVWSLALDAFSIVPLLKHALQSAPEEGLDYTITWSALRDAVYVPTFMRAVHLVLLSSLDSIWSLAKYTKCFVCLQALVYVADGEDVGNADSWYSQWRRSFFGESMLDVMTKVLVKIRAEGDSPGQWEDMARSTAFIYLSVFDLAQYVTAVHQWALSDISFQNHLDHVIGTRVGFTAFGSTGR